LSLPSGQLVRITPPELVAQPDLLKKLADAVVELAPAGDPVQAQRLPDDLARGHAWVQRRVRVLEDHVHDLPVRSQ
jgi:hypothetical protein